MVYGHFNGRVTVLSVQMSATSKWCDRFLNSSRTYILNFHISGDSWDLAST